jgi:hypothetical protein
VLCLVADNTGADGEVVKFTKNDVLMQHKMRIWRWQGKRAGNDLFLLAIVTLRWREVKQAMAGVNRG